MKLSYRLTVMALITGTLLIPLDTVAQELPEGEAHAGTVIRTNWPDYAYETEGALIKPGAQAAENFVDLGLLPFLDSLVISYAYELVDGLPFAAFDVRWTPGSQGVLGGQIVGIDDLPESLRLTELAVHMRVTQQGQYVADMVLELDSLWLASSPDRFEFETADVGWAGFFTDLDADSAKAIFGGGFDLQDLTVLRIGFDSDEPEVLERERKEAVVVRRPPRSATVWTPDFNIWIGWTSGGSRDRVRPRSPRARRPRGDSIGRTGNSNTSGGRSVDRSRPRTAEGRIQGESQDKSPGATAQPQPRAGDSATKEGRGAEKDESRRGARGLFGGKNRDKDDDDDDDDRDLLGPALAGVAVVGAMAYLGGTVGLYGHGEAPIGLQAGRAGERGGFLVQVAVNPDVISSGDNEALLAVATYVLPPLQGAIHPTVGVGAWLDEISDEVKPVATAQIGALVRLDAARVMFAWDAARGGLSFGLGIQLWSN